MTYARLCSVIKTLNPIEKDGMALGKGSRLDHSQQTGDIAFSYFFPCTHKIYTVPYLLINTVARASTTM